MSSAPHPVAAWTYDDWAEALSAFFFSDANAGEEILFTVDAATLAEVGGCDEATAVASLAHAVGLVVLPSYNFMRVRKRVEAWRKSGCTGPHPALPLLAATVLAASRMGENVYLAAHNYYVPLRKLLDQSDTEIGVPGDYRDEIEWLWLDLARWAEHDMAGKHGLVAVQDLGHPKYVRLATQHALLRGSDLRHLDAFFRSIGLEPGDAPPPRELRRALEVWAAARSEPWAKRLQRIAMEADLSSYCERLLAREARRFDGRPRDARTGRAIGRIRVGLDSIRGPAVRVFIQWDERLPASALVRGPSSAEYQLEKWEGWYQPCPLPDVDAAVVMKDGLELRGDGVHYRRSADVDAPRRPRPAANQSTASQDRRPLVRSPRQCRSVQLARRFRCLRSSSLHRST